ncbi:MAG TPA: hypothetical protein VM433_01680 [Mycobacteriales bacterium]|nr:hypothetical protein [Mycobacteriales bacterium]
MLTAVLALAGAVLAPVASASSAAPVPRVDWSVPDRTVAADDGYIDRYYDCRVKLPADSRPHHVDNCSSVNLNPVSSDWQADLDGCASTVASGRKIASYTFTLTGVGHTYGPAAWTSQDCRVTAKLKRLGFYDLTLRVVDDSGSAAQTTTRMQLRDILFASLGDSYGSGEGNPPFSDGPYYRSAYETRCNRSTRAYAAQAALKLEKADPKTSVTFLHLACSGAKVHDHTPRNSTADGGLVDPYEGVNPLPVPGGGKDVLPPQVDYLKALAGDRRIDFLHLSVGGNDMGFASIIKACVDLTHWTKFELWLALPNCDVDITGSGGVGADFKPAVRIFNDGIQRVPRAYQRLNDRLLTAFDHESAETDETGRRLPALLPQQVYLAEYPDPTKDEVGDYCGWPKRPSYVWQGLGSLPGFTQNEFKWASTVVAPSLTEVMRTSAKGYGWNFVDGISAPYATRGYCSKDNWIVTMDESRARQHGENGTFHPNIHGQDAARDRLYPRLADALRKPLTPPTIKLYQGHSIFSSNSAGDGGWHTGNCALPLFGDACQRDAAHYTLLVEDNRAIKNTVGGGLVLTIDGHPVKLERKDNGGIECTPHDPADQCYLSATTPNTVKALFTVTLRRGGPHSLHLKATNVNDQTTEMAADVKVDVVPPTVADAQVTGGVPGKNGWHVAGPVQVAFAGSDEAPGSGLRTIETLLLGAGPGGEHLALPTTGNPAAGAVTASLADEGRHRIGYEAVDHAGLRSGDPLTVTPPGRRELEVNIDTRAPSLTGAPDRAPDARGWYSRPVTVSFEGSDPQPGSGIDASSLTPDTVLTEGAGQRVDGVVADLAGHRATARVGPLSVDTTKPTASVTGGTDGTFSYDAAGLTDGTLVTNSSTLTVGYSASDALSGLHEVRLGAASSTERVGSLGAALPLGPSVQQLQVEDVAGNVRTIDIPVLRVDALVPPDPRGHGFWGSAVRSGAYTEDRFEQLLRGAAAASRSFGDPDGRYAEALTVEQASAVLKPDSPSDPDQRVRRELLTAWLNVVSGREGTTQAVDLAKVKGWSSVVTNTGGSSRTTALNTVRQAERALVGAPDKAQLDRVQQLLEALSSGSLNR